MALGMVLPRADDCVYKRTEASEEVAREYAKNLGKYYRAYKCERCGEYHFRFVGLSRRKTE